MKPKTVHFFDGYDFKYTACGIRIEGQMSGKILVTNDTSSVYCISCMKTHVWRDAVS